MRRLSSLAFLCLAVLAAPAAEPPPADSVPDLIRKLQDKEGFNRIRAAHQLGDMGLAAREAVPALARALHDPAAQVRGRAARALAAIGELAIPSLVEALKDPHLICHRNVAEALGKIGPSAKPAIPALTNLLKHHDETARIAAVIALGEIDSEGASAPALVHILRGADKALRPQIIQSLQKMEDHAIPALREGLTDRVVENRLSVLLALDSLRIDAKELVPSLRPMLKDPDPRIRAHAAAALGWSGEAAKEAVPELLHAVQEKHMLVQIQAANTLMGLAALGVPDVFDKIREVDRKSRWAAPFVLDQFGLRGPAAVAHFIKDLRDKDAKVRIQAATALGALGPGAKAATAALKKALRDEDDDVQVAAAMALTQIEQIKAIDEAIAEKLLGIVKPKPHDGPIAWRRLPPEIVRQQMKDMKLQGHFLSMLHTYVAIVVATDHQPGRGGLLRFNADQAVAQLGPEAVPALVDEINRIVQWRLGFC